MKTPRLAEAGSGNSTMTAKRLLVRGRRLLSQLNLHYAGVAILGLVNLYLLIQIGFAWHAASGQSAEALAQQRVALKTSEIAGRPLQGLDAKLADASVEADSFYQLRLPLDYSEVAAELGVLSKKNAVKLTRVQYGQAPVLGDEAGALTQVNMDASLTGDYRGLVEFMNGLERDRQFFLVSGLTLTGAQSGTVNLRLRLTTYLRGPGSAEEMQKVSIGPVAEPVAAAADGGAR